jgi:TetR/AcrR family transcriptional regulator, regulator of cefoperazone and chloramphenicol sensitivity
MLNMWSAREDRTAKALIRDEALELFARDGPDAVTLRRIAAAAGVSPALVVHHYGSKQRLRVAVDEHVAAVIDAMFADLASADWTADGLGLSFAELLLQQLPPGSPIPGYLRRLLLAGDRAGTDLFRRWHAATTAVLEELVAAGMARPSRDPAIRAAFLLANDVAVLLLREQLSDVLGVDPLGGQGLVRWTDEALSMYRDGLFVPKESP